MACFGWQHKKLWQLRPLAASLRGQHAPCWAPRARDRQPGSSMRTSPSGSHESRASHASSESWSQARH